jgi:hypothetical protein
MNVLQKKNIFERDVLNSLELIWAIVFIESAIPAVK